jgi:energy-coupling factor transporter transmembrane protein EcfT
LHIIVKFACLFVAAFWLANASGPNVWLIFSVLVTSALVMSRHYFFSALRRVKWLLVLMLLVYAYATPGQYLHYWIAETRPTYEGLLLAGVQMIKLLSMLSLLALLIGNVPRNTLLSGLFQLVQPLQKLNIDARPFALRLWLTLHYVEAHQMSARAERSMIAMLHQVATIENDVEPLVDDVTFELVPLSVLDCAQLMLLLALFIGVWV